MPSRDLESLPPAAVLEAFELDADSLTRLTSGHINSTWLGSDAEGRPRVLQCVNSIFSPGVNRDIDAVTSHLRTKGLLAPTLLPTASGRLWLEHDGAVWRTLSHIEGETHETATVARAREAARLLGEFHVALADLDHEFENQRLGVHDTAGHLTALRSAVETRTDHAEHATVAAVAAEIEALAATLEPPPKAPDRIVHGDPKISNVLFEAGTDRALALIDLDTLARMPVALELGDALRSWCNPAPEDAPEAGFSTALFAAAIEGYAMAARTWLQAVERDAIPNATLTIAIELAARFCADALNERYFGWDPTRFPTASAHNLARARAQLGVARAIREARPTLEALVAQGFA